MRTYVFLCRARELSAYNDGNVSSKPLLHQRGSDIFLFKGAPQLQRSAGRESVRVEVCVRASKADDAKKNKTEIVRAVATKARVISKRQGGTTGWGPRNPFVFVRRAPKIRQRRAIDAHGSRDSRAEGSSGTEATQAFQV